MKELVCVELISLNARLKEASKYEFNQALQMECRLLRAQIAALEEFQKTLI